MKTDWLNFREGVLRAADGHEVPWPLLALLGDPVEHSLSPILHEAALAGTKISGHYRCVRVETADFKPCLQAAWQAEVVGLNVTLPHKERALRACGRHSSLSERVGAANTLLRSRTGWEAHNTDVGGLRDALLRHFPFEPWLDECAIVGAGGAARAAVVALSELRAPRVRVLARSVERARWAESFSATAEELESASLDSLSLLIQATPLGLQSRDLSPLDPRRVPRDCAVMDLCYGASPSRLLLAHERRGPVADGKSMLCAQAVRSFRLWFPNTEPKSFMEQALKEPPF